MASGTLGQIDLPANANTGVFTATANKVTVCSVNVCNRTAADLRVRLAVAAAVNPANAEYVEYDSLIPANGVLERTGLILSGGKQLVAFCAAPGISINAYGYEE